jgi:DNA-binding transcriptional LysR family regulator
MSKLESIAEAESKFARTIDWNLFKYFYEIARCGGVGAAARLLNKQQPSVSAALKRLEHQIGTQLCIRTSRGITLTQSGQQLYSFCNGMYSTVQNVQRAKSPVNGDCTGEVTLRVISNLVLPQFNAALSDFHQRYPRIEIKLDVAPWRLVLRSLKGGDVELGIGFDNSPGDDLIYAPMLHEVQQLYCSTHHPLFGRTSRDLERLRDDPFVLAGREETQELTQFRNRHGLGQRVGGIADNLAERMLLIQLGVGIGFLPEAVVKSSATAPLLWPLLPHEIAPRCTIYFMSRANCERNASAQLFLEAMLAHMSDVQAG